MASEKPTSERSGGCVCGKVRYKAQFREGFATCYCKMCQRWSSGAFMGIPAKDFVVTEGEESLKIFSSSDWAVRAFCGNCGSNIYYYAERFGSRSVALGSLDDTDGLRVKVQYFIDDKPQGFSLADETRTIPSAVAEAALRSAQATT